LLKCAEQEITKYEFEVHTGEVTGIGGRWCHEALRDLNLITEQIPGNLGLTMILSEDGRAVLGILQKERQTEIVHASH
jgi:hypothetical protein